MAIGLAIYRGATSAVGSLLGGLLGRFGSYDGIWRAGFRGATPELDRASGSVWVHGASVGEVAMASTWIDALLTHGQSSPLLLTTRTRAGLARARETLAGQVVSRVAPHDVPRIVASLLDRATPSRLDVIETEIWPNLILEARRRSVPVVFVSATVSERTTRGLLGLGLAGPALLGDGVYALPQGEAHATRFEALGVARERIRVIGDLKAVRPARAAGSGPPFGSRPGVLFGSFRPGEERVALSVAEWIESSRDGGGRTGADRSPRRSVAPGFEGRGRSLLVVAPRHREGEGRLRALFGGTRFQLVERDETSRRSTDVGAWIEEVSMLSGPRVGLLATRGELARAYERAWAVLIGGTFAPIGGHNVWEPAGRGCPVIVGRHHGQVSTAVESIVHEGGGVAVDFDRQVVEVLERWMADPHLEQVGAAAERAVARAAGAAERGIGALREWGLAP